jgi:hypothetical protein
MIKVKFNANIFAGTVVLAVLPSLASAQSTISGVVKDSTGAFMAGVSVDAASDALIERSRAVVTASDGRYTIVDVRPGLYTMTFTLPGFSTVKQQVLFHPRENMTLSAEAQIFNIINANTALTESENLGTKVAPYLPGGIGGQPSAIANPRMLRLALQFKF